MKERVKIKELIDSLYPNYFLDKDVPKLEIIYTAGYIDGLITASIIVDAFFDKDEAKDAIIEAINDHLAKPSKNFKNTPK